ncbi:death domain-containing protein [Actinoplanes sp. NPDC049596]|uniref:death domain-containing protein n=1 Tax=unclassified Actinoplanes TaxID=2626549 RepID=UPI00343952EE
MRAAEVRTYFKPRSVRGYTDRMRADVGAVRFGGWQIHPLDSAAFTEDAYLVRAGIDIVTDPGVTPPEWVEAGFDLVTPGAAILDAVPHTVRAAEPARVHRLGPTLNFVPAGPGEPVELPIPVAAQEPALDVYGAGGPHFRWRWHSADGVAPGHRGGWLVLLAPAGARELEVRPWAAFAPPRGHYWEPACDPVDRSVPLPGPPTRRRARAGFTGRAALAFTRRLGDSWPDLAMVLAVPGPDQARFEPGRQAQALWHWLEARDELPTLPAALDDIDRPDLAKLLREFT